MEDGLLWKTESATAIALRLLTFKACHVAVDGKDFQLGKLLFGVNRILIH